MSLFVQGMSSCAVQEIVGLSYHNTAEDAMIRFCKQTLGTNGDCKPDQGYSKYNYGDRDTVSSNKGSYAEGLGENYIFHGPVLYGSKGDYCAKFAAYITENKLGDVVGGQAVINHRYHSSHKCRVYIWNPDRKAVIAFWEKHCKVSAKVETIKIEDPIVVIAPDKPVANFEKDV